MDKSGELKWAVEAAEKAIHANDTARLDSLLAEHPGLLTWRNPDDERPVLLYATNSYANFPGAENEAVPSTGPTVPACCLKLARLCIPGST